MDDGLLAVLLGEEGGYLIDGVFLLEGDFFDHEQIC